MVTPPLPPGLSCLGHLGRGGTADVVRVHDSVRNLKAAYKYPLDEDPETRSAFALLARREHQLIGHLKFPGLVQLLDMSEGDSPYVLMELCEGLSLDRLGRVADVTSALNIVSAMALSLQYLKQHNLVHGDFKPQNVFLPSDWSEPTRSALFWLKLSDFSLGRRSDEPLELRAGLGTVGFMAPEVIAEAKCDHRTDLFALGVTAYAVLTGHHPFIASDDADPVRINSHVCENDPSSISEFRHDLDPEVEEIVHALLEKEPGNRPASAWEVCERLSQAGADYPYRRALQPKHLLSTQRLYTDNVGEALDLSPRQRQRLDLLTDGDNARLRATLTANFVKENLAFNGGRFVFTGGIYWPLSCRRKTLETYATASFGERRRLIEAAVSGDEDSESNPALTGLLRPLLKARTVRSLSARLAPQAEKSVQLSQAARLYMQAGNLDASERCAYQAAVSLNKKHQNQAALNLLNSLLGFAETAGRTFEVRQLMMIRGDILKEIGSSDAAMATYNAIIREYDDEPADKLLAETYKDLGDLYKMKQDYAAGLKALETAQRIYAQLGDELEISHTLNNLGNMHWVGSNYAAALRSYRQALRIQRRHQALEDVGSTLSNIGSIFVVRGKLGRAVRLYRLSIAICREVANQLEEARILNNLGYVLHLRGEPADGVECLERSLVINRRIGTKKEIMFNLENLTLIALAAGQLKSSIGYLREGLGLAVGLDDRPHQAAFKAGLAKAFKRLGRFCEAGALHREASLLYDDAEEHLGRAQLDISLADLQRRIGNHEEALRIALATMRQRAAAEDKPTELEALLVITKISDEAQHLDRARTLATELKLKREILLVEFNALGQRLRSHDHGNSSLERYLDLLTGLDKMPDEIEVPSLCNLAGELMINFGDHGAAEKFLARSQRLATAAGLLPEMVDMYTQCGRMHSELGDFEKAYFCFREALGAAKKITGNISDPDDRQRYQSRPKIKFLVDEIKRLAQSLGHKNKAGA